ncbi:ferredoxin [Nocardia nova]|uniref:ferredoxin n=1 Tax=Nocardia nova TaxID=37330 RepID=UPI00379DBC45
MTVRIEVDRTRCIGAGQCVLALGTVFDHDDAGLVVLLRADVPDEYAERVRQAIELCPAQAITARRRPA